MEHRNAGHGRLLKFRRKGGSVNDPILRAGGLATGTFRALPLGLRRQRLRLALRAGKPTDDFFLAAHDPTLRSEAIAGALKALQRGNLEFAFIARWVSGSPAARTAVLAAAARCPEVEQSRLVGALAFAGGREARAIVEAVFERLHLKKSPARNKKAIYPLISTAGALLRLAPGRVEPASVLLEALVHPDALVRGAAARGIQDGFRPRARGRGVSLIRVQLRRSIRNPDPETFFVIEDALVASSRKGFLSACRRFLADARWRELAVWSLARWSGLRREKGTLVKLARRTHDFETLLAVVGALGEDSPLDLRHRVLQLGFARRSPFERQRTAWLLPRLRDARSIALGQRALRREPDPEIRLQLAEALRGGS